MWFRWGQLTWKLYLNCFSKEKNTRKRVKMHNVLSNYFTAVHQVVTKATQLFGSKQRTCNFWNTEVYGCQLLLTMKCLIYSVISLYHKHKSYITRVLLACSTHPYYKIRLLLCMSTNLIHLLHPQFLKNASQTRVPVWMNASIHLCVPCLHPGLGRRVRRCTACQTSTPVWTATTINSGGRPLCQDAPVVLGRWVSWQGKWQ